MRRKLLFTAVLAALAALGGWLGWLTHVPAPRLELRAEDELHPCFFSDDGSELVTEFVSRKGDDVQRGFIAWDTATGREKERWAAIVAKTDPQAWSTDPCYIGPSYTKHQFHFHRRESDGQMELHVFQVRPWKLLCRVVRDSLPPSSYWHAHMSPRGDALLLS